jgi:mono/diheme cytochrome c family protein
MLNHSAFVARTSALGIVLLVSLPGVLSARPAPSAAKTNKVLTGQQIYEQRCASCHGAKGEGSKQYAKALIGNQSATQLAGFIARSMPPGPGKKCTAPDAKKVAEYLYDAFYSPVAQARNRPARVELAHLTVRQYRNVLTDLVGSFRQTGKPDDRHGLHGEYFKSRRFQNNDRIIDRVDPELKFDWAQSSPDPEKFDAHTFSIRWQGSVTAPDTGEYDFVVRTEHGFRFWVNDLRKPLMDKGVKSGNDTEFHESLYLIGGRSYPVRLEFTKSTQGVDDTDKLKTRPVAKASLSLEWKPPHRAVEVIPQRCLLPVTLPEVFVLSTPFPPDDRSIGYERATSISKEWDDATTEAAFDATGYVASHLRELSGVPDDAPDRGAKLKEFCNRFVTRAFRRPLDPEQQQSFIERQFQSAADPDLAVKRVLLLTLKSARFLYREINTQEADGYDVASRLSFALWDSLPDTELLKAAAAGELSTREQVMRQAERMVNDPRSHSKLREFFLQWLKVDQFPDLAKDTKKYPDFDQQVAADLRTSLELTLEQGIWSEKSDFRELLLSDKVYLNGRLAKLYGVDLPADAPFQPVSLQPGERAGVLTHPYLLSSFAYLDASSPIHRGVMIIRNMLGRTLQPPPVAVAPLAADLHPGLTTRERVILQTKMEPCAGCHTRINPLGFTLEKFDAIGRLRTTENGKPIDTSGGYEARDGKTVKFSGARELAAYLAGSDESHDAFVEKLFHNLVKQPVRAFGPQALPDLEKAFAANDFNIRKQMIETATVAALGPAKKPAAVAAVERH